MFALAFGIGTKNQKNEWLEVYFPNPIFHPNQNLVDEIAAASAYKGGNTDIHLDPNKLRDLATAISDEKQKALVSKMITSNKPVVLTLLESDDNLQSTPEAYLKLHLLSCLLYTSPSPRDGLLSRMPSSA